jgi:hypothetical protein
MKAFNEWLAARVTVVAGSMWCAYVFLCWSLMPIFWGDSEKVVAYVSQAVLQLVLLPAIMVGSAVLSKASNERAEQDHKALMLEVEEIQDILQEVKEDLKLTKEIHAKILGD